MNAEEFRKRAHQTVDWMADYLEQIEAYPVKSQVQAGDTFRQIPDVPPMSGESMDAIMEDFYKIILPGVTHWQSPNFFAYFPANSSYPSLLAEMITATMGAQCMIWETSPAAAELEEKMMEWFKFCMDLPEDFVGCIQDSASSATLCSILTAREKYANYSINEKGFKAQKTLRVYCSEEAHSSIEKSIKIAGIGKDNLVKIAVDDQMALIPSKLKEAIQKDIEDGFQPLCVVAALGTTGTVAMDPLEEIGLICEAHDLWFHVDAAYAGAVLVLPEYRWIAKGLEYADSYTFNPHKWLFTNFDCTAYFFKDKDALVRTFSILPEYLKTETLGKVNDYRDWGMPLGRRFRALKLWFVLRSFGVEGLQEKLREHIRIAQFLSKDIEKANQFEVLAPTVLNLICFRFLPKNTKDPKQVNAINERLLNRINRSGKAYLSHTKINGKYTLRMVVGQTNVTEQHARRAWELIQHCARQGF